ncbi:MAG: glycoside hydrolase family 127 protein [Prolixibacteraceae bacterium]|nr:glycoside hydrolase family 127 protein [Prolixibacteraceae bacterium]
MLKSLFCFIILTVVAIISKGQVVPAPLEAIPFSLHDVRLTDGQFKKAQQLNEKWLQEIDPDRLLSGYRTEAGLNPKGPKYGGWESGGLAGHSLGHYLSALSLMYASTEKKLYKERVNYICSELSMCQKAIGTGFTAGFPNANQIMEQIGKGEIRSSGFDLNGSWVPYYNLHKLFAGLIDASNLTECEEAKSVLLDLAEWFYKLHNPLTDEQIQQILLCEHGGMNEVLADVYAISGDKKFLELSYRFNHKAVLDPLAEGRDELTGKHANTQIPKVVGTAKQFLLTENDKSFKTATYFFDQVTHQHTYCIGGNSSAEYFGEPGHLENRITSSTCETCNSYNMLKLDKLLFMNNPTVELADFYETTLFNHIYASQNPETGMVLYFSPLMTGSKKSDNKGFSSKFDSFWCCVGSGMENHSKYGEAIYFKTFENDLIVNLFIGSELNWTERDLKVTQTTSFPEEGKTSFFLKMDKSQKFAIRLRVPSWTSTDYLVSVNGKALKYHVKPGSYLVINRKWENGDRIDYSFSMPVTTKEIPGNNKLKAFLYGPIVLSASLKEGDREVLVSNGDPGKQLVQISKNPLRFQMINQGDAGVLELMPYYENQGVQAVYFELFTPNEWKKTKDVWLLKKDKEQYLAKSTIDQMRFGEMQPERDHQFEGEKAIVGERLGKKIRETSANGWIEFNMSVKADEAQLLMASFYGNVGSRSFSIFVDGKYLTTETIHWMGDRFVDKSYPIPIDMTKGKELVRIRFQAKDEGMVPAVTEARIMRE